MVHLRNQQRLKLSMIGHRIFPIWCTWETTGHASAPWLLLLRSSLLYTLLASLPMILIHVPHEEETMIFFSSNKSSLLYCTRLGIPIISRIHIHIYQKDQVLPWTPKENSVLFKKKVKSRVLVNSFFSRSHASHPSFFFHISKENYIYNPHLKLTYIHRYIEIYFAGNGLNNIMHVVFKLCSFSAFLIVDTLLLYLCQPL